ncbi:hypothetical protein PG993_010612 [Apiospora rasikravindrae]|uniref:Uncharacterized protein n=1 Tax=Apiospora rasikravindrae TaxID=990691 RepID=A0ABR1SN51_9PEZI
MLLLRLPGLFKPTRDLVRVHRHILPVLRQPPVFVEPPDPAERHRQVRDVLVGRALRPQRAHDRPESQRSMSSLFAKVGVEEEAGASEVSPLLMLFFAAVVDAAVLRPGSGRGLFRSMAMCGSDTDAGRGGSNADSGLASFLLLLVRGRVWGGGLAEQWRVRVSLGNSEYVAVCAEDSEMEEAGVAVGAAAAITESWPYMLNRLRGMLCDFRRDRSPPFCQYACLT